MDYIPFLINLFDQIDVLFLIMVRVFAFLMFLPVLSGMAIPMQVRLFLAVVVSAAVFSSGIVTQVTFVDSVAGIFVLMLTEFMAGAIMGFVLFFVFNTLLFAGQFMDFSMGFAMVNVLDPIQQIQVPIIGNVMFMTMSALLIATGGIHHFMAMFFHSYTLVPMGAAYILGNAPLAFYLGTALVGFVLLAIRIALPIVGTMFIIDVCLGVMVKSVPSMNVFVVGMPVKVLVGLILVFSIIIPNFGLIFDNVFDRAFYSLVEVIERMAIDANANYTYEVE